MANICQICKEEFEEEGSLHKHLRKHKLLLAAYYQTQFPRYDKFDHALIKFKNKEQYLSTDFNTRENLKNWLDSNEPTVVRNYCRALLEYRRDKKGLIWQPTQVELRTTMMPPIQFYDKMFVNYYALCAEIGLKIRFDFQTRALEEDAKTDFKIIVDNREQLPLEFPDVETEWGTVKFGDYVCSNEALTCKCHIERKSLPDLVGTFSGGFERFCREMDRSVEAGAYMIVLVEETLNRCLTFNTAHNVYHKKTKITPEFVFHNIRALIQKYHNLQFLFVDGREKATEAILKIFRSRCSYQKIDLQLAYDTGAF